jgi:predicted transcriptional regulator
MLFCKRIINCPAGISAADCAVTASLINSKKQMTTDNLNMLIVLTTTHKTSQQG